eukprot:TRINITY_DN9790_c0_g1_i1.p1 TRINITY_DN9790_c0_g1~~TRINITY_DN9790_c0_g1_i1.p1  ORF type:complete len:640 (-),score=79.39 TRINITY_DN9790_c0_g1_i1:13-1932(-)
MRGASGTDDEVSSVPSVTAFTIDEHRRFSYTSQILLFAERSQPLLLRSFLGATVLTVVYLLFLQAWAEKWISFYHINDPFSNVWLSPPIYATFLYIALVYFFCSFMESRPPVSQFIFEAMSAYNLYQTCLNSWLFFSFVSEIWNSPTMTLFGNVHDTSRGGYYLGLLIWIQYNNKYVELLDTIFIILRKKFTRISTLHMFQKLLQIWFWYLVCRRNCGGDFYFPAMTNAFVNVFTYGFYLLTLLGVQMPWNYKILNLNRIQCVLCILLSIYQFVSGTADRLTAGVMWFTMVSMCIIFTNFHSETDEFGDIKKQKIKKYRPRVVVSFDSSGWLYMYHFGVASYIEKHILPDSSRDVAFSGSSGGALVAATLATGSSLSMMINRVVSCRDECAFKLWKLLPAAERALDECLMSDAHVKCSGRLQVLLTKASIKPPFFMGEVRKDFTSWKQLWQVLRGSCHIPIVGGLLPYYIEGSWYFDGFFWSATFGFVPWRSWTEEDEVIKVSSMRSLGSHIKPSFPLPPWWGFFPPSEEVLLAMVDEGYKDARKFFETWDSSLGLVSPKLRSRNQQREAEEEKLVLEQDTSKTTLKSKEEDRAQWRPYSSVRLEEKVEQAWMRMGYFLSVLVITPWLLWGNMLWTESV